MKNNSNILYLIGAGGYGKQINAIIKKKRNYSVTHFVDDKLDLNINKFFNLNKKVNFTTTISNPKIREKIFFKSEKKKNFNYKTISLSKKYTLTKEIKKGCIIESNVFIANNVYVGLGNFIFFGTSIAHDVTIGNFCNIGCNVAISGNVKIGKKVIIGANSFISNNLKICDRVIISPGSIILKDIKKSGVYQNNTLIKNL